MTFRSEPCGEYEDLVAEARARASTPAEHLWCLALALGPDGSPMWETADGTPVDVARHLIALAEHLAAAKMP